MSLFVKRPCEEAGARAEGRVAVAAPRRAIWALVAAVLGSSMSFIDGSAVNVALPVLQRDLGASAASAQWVVEGYALFLSALLLTGGSLADIYGRRFVYGAGIVLFALASGLCAFAPNVEVLIFARCLQGAGGALATPGSLALISASFSGEARGKAIGTWSGFSAITSVVGPVLGGWLVQFGSWRWVFAINIPIALAVIAILALRVAESRDETAARALDVPGACLATLGLGALVYGLIGVQDGKPSALAVAAILVGIGALAAFLVVEARSPHAMVPLGLFRSRRFSAANAYTFLLYAALGGSLYFVPFDLIDVQHYPPSEAGAALLPMILIMFTLARFSGGLVTRIGARVPLAAGALLAACGFAIFAFAGAGGSYWTTFFPGAVVLGFGGACFVAPLTTTVMDALDPSRAGVASGVNNAVSRTAGLVAVAALGIALAGVFQTTLTANLAAAPLTRATRVAAARAGARLITGGPALEIRDPRERAVAEAAARSAYAAGFRVAMLIAAFLALLAAPLGLDRSFRQRPSSR